jgi:Domain of unknown function (DUF4129)
VARSRLVPLALAVTALLAVVALAAHGRPLGSRGGNGGALPSSFWDYTYTTIIIIVVPLALTGVVAAAYVRRRGAKKPRSYWHSLLRSLAVWAVFVALELLLVRSGYLQHVFRFHMLPPHEAATNFGGQGPNGTNHQQRVGGTRPVHFRWGELLVVLGLLLVAGTVIAAKLSRKEPRPPSEVAPEALASALDESIDDLRGDTDLRRAIVAAYARMETALAAAGVPRRPAEAPLEYLERVLLSLDASAEAVRRLTDLFEWARFSHHEPEPAMRDDAVDALIAVRDELRASELTPA